MDRLRGKHRKAERARQTELSGDLAAAVELYLAAELPDDAARVLLLRVDAERDPERRLALAAQAARIGEGTPHGDRAHKRKALLSFGLLKASAGAAMQGELLEVAAELERAGEWRAAAEAFALAGDTDAEIRVLKDAGDIGGLETRLRETSDRARKERDRGMLLRRIADLDSIAERREALRIANEWLVAVRTKGEAPGPEDELVSVEIDRIERRLLRGPSVMLEIGGTLRRCVLGSEVTVGRARADIVVHSSAVSRQHLKLCRRDGVAQIVDLSTRNGTLLAGARVSGTLDLRGEIELELAGQVRCRLRAEDGEPAVVEIAGETYVVPLGPLRVGHFEIVDAHDGDQNYVILRTPPGREPPHMAGYRLAQRIELCVGDRIHEVRDGPLILSVPDQPRAEPE
jgi:hypothetical protein